MNINDNKLECDIWYTNVTAIDRIRNREEFVIINHYIIHLTMIQNFQFRLRARQTASHSRFQHCDINLTLTFVMSIWKPLV